MLTMVVFRTFREFNFRPATIEVPTPELFDRMLQLYFGSKYGMRAYLVDHVNGKLVDSYIHEEAPRVV